MAQKNRLEGGLINRKNPWAFEFNGQSMQGFEVIHLRQHCLQTM